MAEERSGSDPAREDQGPAVRALIAALHSSDGMERTEARRLLVRIGRPAVYALIAGLSSPSKRMRWEAAKALAEIGDPIAAPALVIALEDNEADIRWLAAEGLIALGRSGLAALLGALMGSDTSVWRREGAHHVLHDLARGELHDQLAPVLAALESVHPDSQVPQAALVALSSLQESAPSQARLGPSAPVTRK